MNDQINPETKPNDSPTGDGNKFGLSRKSNVAMAAIAGLAAVQQSIYAVAAIVVIALTAILTQTLLDWFDKDDSY